MTSNTKHIALMVIFLLGYWLCYAQNTLYINYDLQEISEDEFKSLTKSRSITSYIHQKDTITIKKIGLKHWFGQLDSIQYNKIRNYINFKSKNQLKKDDYIVIALIDTLHSYDSYVKNFIRNYRYNPERHKHLEVSEIHNTKIIRRELLRNKNDFLSFVDKKMKNTIACKNRIEKKYNAKVYHIYNEKYNEKPLNPELDWLDNYAVFKDLFFPFEYRNKVIIIKPDGAFFVTSSYSLRLEKALIKHKNWNKYEKKLHKIYKDNPNYYEQGIFFVLEKNKCFTI